MKNFLSLLWLSILFSCETPEKSDYLSFSTSSDSTLFYYQQGWQQIMDEGNYGPAEASYRKALEFDPEFLVGQAVLARLTLDLEERLAIEKELKERQGELKGLERKVFDVYHGLTTFTNFREQNPELASAKLKEVLELAFKNFGEVVRQQPEEIYLKAEYIEIIHSLQGPQATLDSIENLLLPTQENNPFLLGYAASMHAELYQFEEALQKAKELEVVLNNPELPKSHAVFADVYAKMDSLDLALQYATRANRLDPRNLDASRLKARIEKDLNE